MRLPQDDQATPIAVRRLRPPHGGLTSSVGAGHARHNRPLPHHKRAPMICSQVVKFVPELSRALNVAVCDAATGRPECWTRRRLEHAPSKGPWLDEAPPVIQKSLVADTLVLEEGGVAVVLHHSCRSTRLIRQSTCLPHVLRALPCVRLAEQFATSAKMGCLPQQCQPHR